MKHKLSHGLIQVYTGNGKGKTTAAIGAAVRAYGQGLKVLFAQFLKNKDDFSGELLALEKLSPGIKVMRFDQTHPVFFKKNPGKGEIEKLRISVEKALRDIEEVMKKYDMVVLDEIINCVAGGFISKEKLIRFLKGKPENTEIILTGRDAGQWILKLAGLATGMKNIKHPYVKGIKARKGIEY